MFVSGLVVVAVIFALADVGEEYLRFREQRFHRFVFRFGEWYLSKV